MYGPCFTAVYFGGICRGSNIDCDPDNELTLVRMATECIYGSTREQTADTVFREENLMSRS